MMSLLCVQTHWIQLKYILSTFLLLSNATSEIPVNSQKKKLELEHLLSFLLPLLPQLILSELLSLPPEFCKSWFM